MKSKAGVPYRVERRTINKRTGKHLSAYAVDITIRVNDGEAYFLDDNNNARPAMPHNNRQELVDTLLAELERNHIEHFGHA
jgi:hypothetical protein